MLLAAAMLIDRGDFNHRTRLCSSSGVAEFGVLGTTVTWAVEGPARWERAVLFGPGRDAHRPAGT